MRADVGEAGRGPTGAREHFRGSGVISTTGGKGAREGARVKIPSGAPAKCGSGEQVGPRTAVASKVSASQGGRGFL